MWLHVGYGVSVELARRTFQHVTSIMHMAEAGTDCSSVLRCAVDEPLCLTNFARQLTYPCGVLAQYAMPLCGALLTQEGPYLPCGTHPCLMVQLTG